MLLAAAVLYGGTFALASEPAAPFSPPPAANPAQAQPAPGAGLSPPDAPSPERDAPSAKPDETPHIALLLPLASSTFGRHAEAVRSGFLAAAKVAGGAALPVRAYAVGDDPKQSVAAYVKALGAGARVVVGPLTRSGVTALAESATVMVPTLALNVPETSNPTTREIYLLNLQVEAEARQVAQLAYQDGYRRAITINGGSPLLKRVHQAFVEEFTRLGGTHAAEYAYSGDPSALQRMKQSITAGSSDMVFLALDLDRARLARPYVGARPIYATSLVYPANAGPLAGFDLVGIRFLDMPWLLQPDHAAVMAYPRPDYRDAVELERFYALGIDAFRVVQALIAGTAGSALDGVTGKLTLGADHQFIRGLTPVQFADGKLVVRERP